MTFKRHTRGLSHLALILIIALSKCARSDDWQTDYYLDGPKAGSLRKSEPLPIFARDPNHLWNRLFAAFYIRESALLDDSGKPLRRIEGGDYIDLLAWGKTTHWDKPDNVLKLTNLLKEFRTKDGESMITDPLKRTIMIRDLWAAYDFLVDKNMRRTGSLKTRQQRSRLCEQLARLIESLATKQQRLANLPNTYAAAVASGAFKATQTFDKDERYLPPQLLSGKSRWVEIDFHQPNIHEDLYDRFITLHTRAYKGCSYFRVFYRFPKGRKAVVSYLQQLDRDAVNWRQAAQNGFILLKENAPQIPVGTEVALVQFMMTLDNKLQPQPTSIVESIRHRTYRNVDGSNEPRTNTGVGMHVTEYTMKRRLLFDKLKHGGLHREPDEQPLYRVIFQPSDAVDWGTHKREPLQQQCVNCHMTPKANRTGVHSIPSIVHMGGFDAGAQLGIAHAIAIGKSSPRGQRAARWKRQHETYRRMLEYLDR